MGLEDKAYRGWKDWAMQESERLRQVQGAAYTGTDAEEGVDSEENGPGEDAQAQEVAESVPGSKKGQGAEGGVLVHP